MDLPLHPNNRANRAHGRFISPALVGLSRGCRLCELIERREQVTRTRGNQYDECKRIAQLPYKPLADAPGTVEIEKQLEWYRLIHLGRLLDDKARNYLRQAKGWSYHASHAGHDGIQVALGLAFRPNKDCLFPYYRDMLTAWRRESRLTRSS